MKIAINTLSIVPGEVGGTETFLVNLVKNLIKIDKKNKYLFIVSSNNKRTFTTDSESVEYLEFNFDNNSRLRRVFFEQLILPRKLKENKVDFLIAPGNTGLIYCPCKLIVIVQSILYFSYPKFFSLVKRKYLQLLVKYSCKKAERVLTTSLCAKEDIIKHTNINPNKVGVIYEGVDFRFFNERGKVEFIQSVINEYKIKDSYIFSPTSLYDYKNNDLLIKAFALLKKRKQISEKLVITGVDPNNKLSRLKKIIQSLNLEKEVLYLGSVPHEYMPIFYQRAKMTAFLSSYETFGLPVLESMAAGCPVLSSNRSSLPEVVGDAGILVDPFNIEDVASKMYELLANGDIRKRCINKGFVRAKEFSWENVARRLIKIYSYL